MSGKQKTRANSKADLTDSELMLLFHSILSDGAHTPTVKIAINTFPAQGDRFLCIYDGLDDAVKGKGSGDTIREAILNAFEQVGSQVSKIEKVLWRFLDQARAIENLRKAERLKMGRTPKKKKA